MIVTSSGQRPLYANSHADDQEPALVNLEPLNDTQVHHDQAVVIKASKLRKALICLSGFIIVFISSGTLFAFGVYQELYEDMSHQPGNPFTGSNPASIGMIGTLAVSFMTIGAPFVSSWARCFSPRNVILIGGIAFGLSSVIASFCQQLWQFILAQGLLFGLGICLAFIPAMIVPPTWYDERRGLAMGIISGGTGIGGLVWAPAIKAMMDRFGYRNALRISGGVTGLSLILVSFTLDWDPVTKQRLSTQAAERAEKGIPWQRELWKIKLVNWKVAKRRKFMAQLVASSLQSAAYYTPIFFLSAYSRTLGYSRTDGANFIAVSNALNFIAKFAAGVIADKFGRINTLQGTTALSAAATYGLWVSSCLVQDNSVGRGLFVAFVVAYGCFASPYVALFPASLVELFGPQNFAGINGALYLSRGMASLIGIPVAGALVRSSGGDTNPSAYLGMAILVGSLMLATSLSVAWLQIESRKDKDGDRV